ncbi:hypothetical protein GOBAR_AA01560 [Gossypium barbadense]|uniref:Chromophore lyase CpcT/CpeT n=1 Tax=Gossypium barbadense TaxID=3634 RepID=A0A2P5YTX6_GOSBA|nr:hypothetical protein GOBAR_AA01560 [Gossypium barbadense]
MAKGSDPNGWSRARGLVVKTLVLIGGAFLLKRLTKSTTRWDHAKIVARSLSGEKFSREQASRDPDNYFNFRILTCPATEMVDGSKVLYFEQAFWRTPQKPFRQRFLMVKPCPKDLKCDVEVCFYTDLLKVLTSRLNGATHFTSELMVLKNNEIHTWDRGYDDEGNQVWGVKEGPYEFKPAPASSFNGMFSPLNFPLSQPLEKKIEGSFVLQE